MPVTPNPRQLGEVEALLRQLARGDWVGQLAQRISAGGVKLVADEFRDERDPYGDKWAPLASERPRNRRARLRAIARGRAPKGQKILQHTGRMKGSVGASPNGRQARVVIPTWYAAVHQNGAYIPPHSRINTGALAHRARMRQLGFETFGSIRRATFTAGYRLPRRMMLPDEKRGLPPTWQAMVERESNGLMRQKFGIGR